MIPKLKDFIQSKSINNNLLIFCKNSRKYEVFDLFNILDEFEKLNPPSPINPKFNTLPQTYQTIINTLIDKMAVQSEKGIKKYGQNIDSNQNLNPEYWLNHLFEELADGLVYFQKFIESKKD